MRTTNGAADYIQLDNVRLDGHGWNYKRAIAPSTPSVRSAASTMPGRPGRVYVPGTDVHDPAEVAIKLEVFAADPVTGLVGGPFNDRRSQLEDNLQTLLGVIGRPGRTIAYKYVDADGTVWQADATVAVPAKVDIRQNNWTADVTFSLEIPSVYLRSTNTVTANAAAGSDVTLAALTGGTAPIYDAVVTVPGSATNPKIQVGDQWVAYNGTVSNWTVDVGAMTSRNGAGQSVILNTGWSGTTMLVLTPTADADGKHTYKISSTHPVTVVARKARFA